MYINVQDFAKIGRSNLPLLSPSFNFSEETLQRSQIWEVKNYFAEYVNK